jgi:hypothetical protein
MSFARPPVRDNRDDEKEQNRVHVRRGDHKPPISRAAGLSLRQVI